MRLISTELGLAGSDIFTLAAEPAGGFPLTQKTTPTITRIGKDKLEQAYISNPIIFNSINKIQDCSGHIVRRI